MIRFSASLVVIAMGLLVAGGVTSTLLLVYVAIALGVVALIFLITGAILHRGEFRARPSGETAGTAAGTAAGTTAGGDAQDAEAESPPLAGAASASVALAGRAWAARSGAAAKDTASAAGTGRPPWPDSPPPAGPDRWAAFERIADRRRPDVLRPGDRPSAPGGPSGPGEPGGRGGGPEEQWPGRRLPDEIQLHAPWPGQDWSAGRRLPEPRPREEGPADQPPADQRPADQRPADQRPADQRPADQRPADQRPADQRPATPAPATFGWLTPDRPGKSGAPETGVPNLPRERPSAGPEAEAIPEPQPIASAWPKTEQQMAAPQPAESGAGDSQPAKPEAAKPETAKPEATDARPAQSRSSELEPGEPESAKPEPGERGSGEPVRAKAEPSGQVVTVVPGVPRYHRRDCILIRFMGNNDLQKMPVEAAREAGCTPCRACQPDGEDVG